MHPVVRNVLAVLAGLIVGSIVNFGIIMISDQIIQAPAGVDVSDPQSLKENIHLFSPKHFVFPFLAHAIGTLVGAYTAARIGVNNNMTLALVIGGLFLIGGIMMVMSVGGPMWFNILDIVGAYIPMAWLGGKMAMKSNS